MSNPNPVTPPVKPSTLERLEHLLIAVGAVEPMEPGSTVESAVTSGVVAMIAMLGAARAAAQEWGATEARLTSDLATVESLHRNLDEQCRALAAQLDRAADEHAREVARLRGEHTREVDHWRAQLGLRTAECDDLRRALAQRSDAKRARGAKAVAR